MRTVGHVLAVCGIVLLCVLGLVLVLIACVLFIPVPYRLSWNDSDGFVVRIWCLIAYSSKRQRKPGRKKTQKASKPPESKRQEPLCEKLEGFVRFVRIILLEENRELYLRTARRLWKALRPALPRRVRASLTVGTGSPDTTGYLCAAYGVMQPFIGRKRYAVTLDADFEHRVVQGYIEASGRIYVYRIVAAVVRILTDRQFRVLISSLRRTGHGRE